MKKYKKIIIIALLLFCTNYVNATKINTQNLENQTNDNLNLEKNAVYNKNSDDDFLKIKIILKSLGYKKKEFDEELNKILKSSKNLSKQKNLPSTYLIKAKNSSYDYMLYFSIDSKNSKNPELKVEYSKVRTKNDKIISASEKKSISQIYEEKDFNIIRYKVSDSDFWKIVEFLKCLNYDYNEIIEIIEDIKFFLNNPQSQIFLKCTPSGSLIYEGNKISKYNLEFSIDPENPNNPILNVFYKKVEKNSNNEEIEIEIKSINQIYQDKDLNLKTNEFYEISRTYGSFYYLEENDFELIERFLKYIGYNDNDIPNIISDISQYIVDYITQLNFLYSPNLTPIYEIKNDNLKYDYYLIFCADPANPNNPVLDVHYKKVKKNSNIKEFEKALNYPIGTLLKKDETIRYDLNHNDEMFIKKIFKKLHLKDDIFYSEINQIKNKLNEKENKEKLNKGETFTYTFENVGYYIIFQKDLFNPQNPFLIVNYKFEKDNENKYKLGNDYYDAIKYYLNILLPSSDEVEFHLNKIEKYIKNNQFKIDIDDGFIDENLNSTFIERDNFIFNINRNFAYPNSYKLTVNNIMLANSYGAVQPNNKKNIIDQVKDIKNLENHIYFSNRNLKTLEKLGILNEKKLNGKKNILDVLKKNIALELSKLKEKGEDIYSQPFEMFFTIVLDKNDYNLNKDEQNLLNKYKKMNNISDDDKESLEKIEESIRTKFLKFKVEYKDIYFEIRSIKMSEKHHYEEQTKQIEQQEYEKNSNALYKIKYDDFINIRNFLIKNNIDRKEINKILNWLKEYILKFEIQKKLKLSGKILFPIYYKIDPEKTYILEFCRDPYNNNNFNLIVKCAEMNTKDFEKAEHENKYDKIYKLNFYDISTMSSNYISSSQNQNHNSLEIIKEESEEEEEEEMIKDYSQSSYENLYENLYEKYIKKTNINFDKEYFIQTVGKYFNDKITIDDIIQNSEIRGIGRFLKNIFAKNDGKEEFLEKNLPKLLFFDDETVITYIKIIFYFLKNEEYDKLKKDDTTVLITKLFKGVEFSELEKEEPLTYGVVQIFCDYLN